MLLGLFLPPRFCLQGISSCAGSQDPLWALSSTGNQCSVLQTALSCCLWLAALLGFRLSEGFICLTCLSEWVVGAYRLLQETGFLWVPQPISIPKWTFFNPHLAGGSGHTGVAGTEVSRCSAPLSISCAEIPTSSLRSLLPVHRLALNILLYSRSQGPKCDILVLLVVLPRLCAWLLSVSNQRTGKQMAKTLHHFI